MSQCLCSVTQSIVPYHSLFERCLYSPENFKPSGRLGFGVGGSLVFLQIIEAAHPFGRPPVLKLEDLRTLLHS